MELWDAYHADGTLADFDLIRGEKIPSDYFHMVCEAVIQHVDGDYLLMHYGYLLKTACDKDTIQLQENETIAYQWISQNELFEFYDNQCPPTLRDRLKDYIESVR